MPDEKTDRVPASSVVLAYSEKTTALTADQSNAVSQGHIKVTPVEVVIKAASAPDKKDHFVPFSDISAVNMKGVLSLANGLVDKENAEMDSADKVIVSLFNGALSASRRTLVRQKLAAEVEGPEKKFESAAKTLFKTGLFPTLDAALAAVKASVPK